MTKILLLLIGITVHAFALTSQEQMEPHIKIESRLEQSYNKGESFFFSEIEKIIKENSDIRYLHRILLQETVCDGYLSRVKNKQRLVELVCETFPIHETSLTYYGFFHMYLSDLPKDYFSEKSRNILTKKNIN